MSYMEIRNLKKVYNPYGVHPKVALNGLDFEVEKGDRFPESRKPILTHLRCFAK